jgi:hypothetical protein
VWLLSRALLIFESLPLKTIGELRPDFAKIPLKQNRTQQKDASK